MTFKIGQRVKWTSSSNGSTTTKTGEVVMVIPPRGDVRISPLMQRFGATSNYGHGNRRDHESYIVVVPGKTEKAKPALYWPRVAALKAAK